METFTYTLSVTFVISLILLYFPNKSGFSTHLVVPFLTALLVKYILGDWDNGYKWSMSDIQYFSAILATSYGTTLLISKTV